MIVKDDIINMYVHTLISVGFLSSVTDTKLLLRSCNKKTNSSYCNDLLNHFHTYHIFINEF